MRNPFGAERTLSTAVGEVRYFGLDALEAAGFGLVSRAPYCWKVVLESLLRNVDGVEVTEEDVVLAAKWSSRCADADVPFKPARVLLQDFTGVPVLADLAALRSAVARLGGDAAAVEPVLPAELVVDHSVQVDVAGRADAQAVNMRLELERNLERYRFLKWGQQAFRTFRVVPPGVGIVHQVNLERLARGLVVRDDGVVHPDSVVGTDSHTTTINGLGVVGWGVGGIEAEAAMLGMAVCMPFPEFLGVRLTGRLPEGATATDLALLVTQRLRMRGVVGRFVEFFGPALDVLSLEDRATVANMAPEYGATMGFFPWDSAAMSFLRRTGRDSYQVDLLERYARLQGMFRTDDSEDPDYPEILEIDLGEAEPSVAGPRRPQDRIVLSKVKDGFRAALWRPQKENGFEVAEGQLDAEAEVVTRGRREVLRHGSVVLAAITSCTNTANPALMLAAGIVARNAVERGLEVPAYVKTSLAPGSQVVTDYLSSAGLLPALERLGFHVVGYGCTTCIGNSGPLDEAVAGGVRDGSLVVAAVLSGNRNFEGRVHPLTRANYLASPPLVVAYALAGRVDVDLATERIGEDREGRPVFLRDLWPEPGELARLAEAAGAADVYRAVYDGALGGSREWKEIESDSGVLFGWKPDSTYIQEPPFLLGVSSRVPPVAAIEGARVLAWLGDSVTTDHISPAGSIGAASPAGRYLQSLGVRPAEFNSYGARRGNDRVMVRGTFANPRLRNRLVAGREGGITVHLPTGETLTIYDASERYREEGTPLVVIAGKEYGTGSSRDWAAKGTALLGIRVVVAESFERIHRSNLIGMGVLPLQFLPGESAESWGLAGTERITVAVGEDLRPGAKVAVTLESADGGGERRIVTAVARLDTEAEVVNYRHGGILPAVLRRILDGAQPGSRRDV
ncbi:MAG: aconitate hydratase AcnA [Deltaproteobacteria bacterium]|nr:aconitate hydratase AcnA [Deltaproteobacteria bacterium]